jgi:hypothetical protein
LRRIFGRVSSDARCRSSRSSQRRARLAKCTLLRRDRSRDDE